MSEHESLIKQSTVINEQQTQRIAQRAKRMLESLSLQIQEQKKEFEIKGYHQTYSKAALTKLPFLTKAIVDKTVLEMESKNYPFAKKKAGNSEKYALTINNIMDIYQHRDIPKYRDKHSEAFTIFIGNLKGGVSKTVSSVSLAHSLRTHPDLLHHDLRILVIDLDPQSSATMFLSHLHTVGSVDTTSAQILLQNPSRDEILNEFIIPSDIPNVDLIPASIDDAFIASKWEELCNEYLPNQPLNSILKKNLIDKVKHDYDFIFIDSGPHLDAFLMNSLVASNLLMTPIPPAQVDFHSTLKYLTRLPELMELIQESGEKLRLQGHIGFMSKLAQKVDHRTCHSLAKEIFGGDMLDVVLPRLDGFERCGESFNTVISVNPATYVGSTEALKKARLAAEDFAKAVFDRIEFIRTNEQ